MDLRTGAFPRRRAVALAIAATLAAGQASAATINVTSLLDGPPTADTVCTLREALESLATGAAAFGCTATGAFGTADAVTFGVTGTIALDPTQGALDVVSDSTITGPGAAQLTISGGGNVPVVYVTDANAAISGVTITNGRGGKGAGGVTAIGAQVSLAQCSITQNQGGLGGGVLGYASLVAIDDCTITGNTSVVGGGVGLLGSAALVSNATITGNSAGGFPDRPFESGRPALAALALPSGDALLEPDGTGLPPGTGGGIAAVGDVAPPPAQRNVARPAGVPLQVVVSDSNVSGNTAAVIGGGVVFYGVPALVESTTISGNTALRAGGLAAGSAPLAVEQVTISGNSATGDGKAPGGGNFVVFGANAPAPLQIASSTITGNTAVVRNGGIELYGDVPLTMSSTIVANSTGLDPADIVIDNAPAPVVTRSLVENPGASGIGIAGGNLVGVDPQLGPLADNGGPAPTHVPGAGSPVIDAGANPTGAAFDQRGAPFARVVGAGPDVGSIERGNGASPSFVANVPATSTFGTMLLAAAVAALAWLRRPRRARRTR